MTSPHISEGNPAASHCVGKERFESRTLAAQVGSRKTRRTEASLRPYRCASCNGWHLANMKRPSALKMTNAKKTGGYRG